MKINSALPTVGTSAGAGVTRGPAAPTTRPAGAAGERVDISPLSVQLQEVGAGGTPFDAQRVAEIRAAISEGRFQIHPERIADGLLASVRELLGRQGKSG